MMIQIRENFGNGFKPVGYVRWNPELKRAEVSSKSAHFWIMLKGDPPQGQSDVMKLPVQFQHSQLSTAVPVPDVENRKLKWFPFRKARKHEHL